MDQGMFFDFSLPIHPPFSGRKLEIASFLMAL
jgi:hypothetical protein